MDLIKTLFLLLSVGGTLAQDALPPGPVYAVLGSNVTFNTTLGRGVSFITVSWSFSDGSELVPVVTMVGTTSHEGDDFVGRVSMDNRTGALRLGPVKLSDSGDYSVNMVDSDAVAQTGETSLRVLVPVSKVEIKPSMAEAAETNSTVVLNCSALGSFLTFTWTNGTAPLLGDGKRITIKHDDLSSSVTIKGVRRWDLKGPIYCTAANKLEKERSAPFNMTVYYGPDAMVMKVQPLVVGGFVRRGSNVTLSCVAVSSPAATLSWFHNGVVLAGKTGPTLVLSGITEKQGGKYHCSAQNPKTLRTVDAPANNFVVLEAISGAKITPPKESFTAGDVMVNFTCAAAAGTVYTTVWSKDTKALVASERVAINGSRLMFKKLQKEDRGAYTCRLANGINSEIATYKMIIFYGPDDVKISGKSAVEVSDQVTLTCNADSYPVPEFKWRFNGTYLDVKTAQHTIAHAAYKDTGAYTCEVANAKTKLTGKASLDLAVKEEGALDEGLSGGAIAGIVIAVLVALGLAIAGVIYFKRKQTIESPY